MTKENKCQQCGAELPANAPGGVCPKCVMKLGLPTGADPERPPIQDNQNAVPTSATPPGGFVPPEPAELAEKLPGIEIIELLGQGGMGAVYKARQKQLDRIVALKILPTVISKDPAFAERFTREARSLAKLNHPHIVNIYDFGRSNELCYFIMEFVDGTDLRQVIQAGKLAPEQALAIVPQICEALQYAHEEGFVHRDIKPENIFLDKKGRVKIGDFGLAKILNRPPTDFTLTQPQQRMGTPNYMAPEQIEGASSVDHRADIYSLGVVFYEMLTGELPLGRFDPPSRKVRVDIRLDEVVLHTLEKEPARRYQHASDIKTDVETIGAQPAAAVLERPRAEAKHRQEQFTASEEDIEEARQALRIPSIGIRITGLLDCLILIGLPLMIVLTTVPGKGRGVSILGGVFELALMIVMLIPSIVIFMGGMAMPKCKSHGLAVAAAILAVAPIHPAFWLGLPFGIWALVILSRSEIRRAFTGASERAPAATTEKESSASKPGKNRDSKRSLGVFSMCSAILGVIATILLWLLFVILERFDIQAPYTICAIVFVGAEVIALITGIVGWRSPYGKAGVGISALLLLLVSFIMPVRVDKTYGPTNVPTTQRLIPHITNFPKKIGDLDFPFGRHDYVNFDSAGPTLTEPCRQLIDLKPSEAIAVNEILQQAYKDFLRIERQHTAKQRTGNRLVVTIEPFEVEAKNFLSGLWDDLDLVLDERQRAIARNHLPLGTIFGDFQFGEPTVIHTITTEDDRFKYETKYQWPEGSGKSGGGLSGSTNKLPERYRDYWFETESTSKSVDKRQQSTIPVSDNPAYEKADGTQDLQINVGPTQFSINTVARWGRTGHPIFENGKGITLGPPDFDTPDYSAQAHWMDITNIYLSPDASQHDVLELRIFDHSTKELLQLEDRVAVGYDVDNSVVQLRSMGKLLPASVDVWMRVLHNPPTSPMWRLNAQQGSSAGLDEGSLLFREVRDGSWSYSTRSGSLEPLPDGRKLSVAKVEWNKWSETGATVCTAVFDFVNTKASMLGNNDKYQIAAIAKDGSRHVPDFPHFLSGGAGKTQVIKFDLPAEQLSHFEIRPFHGRDRFYFDGIQLPRVGDSLGIPPTAMINLNGEEASVTIEDFAPVKVKVTVLKGDRASGVESRLNKAWVTMSEEPHANTDSMVTIVYEIDGLRCGRCSFRCLGADGAALEARSGGSASSGHSYGFSAGYKTKRVPIEKIDKVIFSIH